MSIAFERNSSGNDNRIELPGFARHQMNFVSPIYNSQDFPAADRMLVEVDPAEEDRIDPVSSSSSSSIGKNSDEEVSGDGDGDGEGEEVQSEYKKGALDSLDALDEVLPVKYVILYLYIFTFDMLVKLADFSNLIFFRVLIMMN